MTLAIAAEAPLQDDVRLLVAEQWSVFYEKAFA